MKKAIETTATRRKLQQEYNEKHHITPKTIIKGFDSEIAISNKFKKQKDKNGKDKISRADILKEIDRLKDLMNASVRTLDFESAIKLRDRIAELKLMLNEWYRQQKKQPFKHIQNK